MGSLESKMKQLVSEPSPQAAPAAATVETPIASDPEVSPAPPTVVHSGLARIVFPPTVEPPTSDRRSVFLAGSIDMGAAIDWQAEITKSLSDLPINLYNPRRPNWDPSWIQDIAFPPFREQVEWELGMLDKVDVIAMFLPENSIAPISLLELGLYASSKRLIVGCPKKFHRRGNVEITCLRYGVKMVDTLEELVIEVRHSLAAKSESVPSSAQEVVR